MEIATDANQSSQSAAASAAAAAAEAAAPNGDDSADVTDDKPNVALRTAVEMLSVVLSGYAVSGGRARTASVRSFTTYIAVCGETIKGVGTPAA